MTQKKDSFLINRLKSVGYAFKGAVYLIRTESSIKIQVCIAIAVTIAGFYFDISKIKTLVGFAIVSKDYTAKSNAEIEKLFLNKPLEVFDVLEDAITWAKSVLD